VPDIDKKTKTRLNSGGGVVTMEMDDDDGDEGEVVEVIITAAEPRWGSRSGRLEKFDFVIVNTTSTPIKTNKALLKDEEAEDVDVNLYRSMIRSLMYLTTSRPDIMFDVCASARFQVTPKVLHLHAVKRIFRYLKGQPKLALWYPMDSTFDLEAFSDSDYARASLDRKSTTGGCQFLGKRLLWDPNQMLGLWGHIEIRHHFIRDSYEKKLIQVIKIHTNHNVADLLKKAFDVSRLDEGNVHYADVDETVIKEWEDRMERAATTASSLEAEQDSVLRLHPGMNLVALWHLLSYVCTPNIIFNFSKYIFGHMVKNLEGGVKFLMYPRFVQVFLDKQVEGMSRHKGIYVIPSHTKKVFANMKRPGKGFSGKVTPLFETMMVQATEDMGEDSAAPTDSHSTPIHTQPSSSKPQKKKSRRKQRKDSGPKEVAEKEVSAADPVTTAGEVVTSGNVEVTTTNAPTTTIDELTLAQTLIEIQAAKPKAITFAATITTTTRPQG
ncbi:hypothetical protein Tco_1091986, partial [Tanacetum coccineum]